MKRQLAVTFAAVVVGGGVAVLCGPSTRAEDKPDQSAKAADQSDSSAKAADRSDDSASAAKSSEGHRVTFPAGVKLKDNPTKEDHGAILKPIASLTEAVLTKDG